EQLLARGRLRATLAMLGPAFVAAIAYVDPGNFATNVAGGARYGFLLIWVVLAANLMAMLIQYLSAKLGIITDRNLPESFRFRYAALKIGASASGVANGLSPHLGDTEAVYLAVGIIGATVMPHAIYLHSALTQGRMPCRNDAERARVLRFERFDVIVALGLAG